MSETRKPITVHGKAALEAELERLVQKERPQIVKAIEEARGHGDLSENADYAAAKERQGHIEGRIGEINNVLRNADVVDPSTIRSDRITFGAHVCLVDDDGKEVTYQIVGQDEADVSQSKISVHSPLARQLIGKKKTDQFELQNPSGEKMYQIQDFYFK